MQDHDFSTLYRTMVDKIWSWGEALAALLPNALVAFLLFAVFWALSKIAGNVAHRTLRRMRVEDAAQRLMATLVRLIVLGAGGTIALGVLHLDKALASLLAGAGIAGLALGFAFQDLAANLISGVGLAIKRDHPFKTGDLIETHDVTGTVQHIDLRTSTLQTLDGKTVIIPNKEMYQSILVNYSTSGKRRVELVVGVSYGEDLEHVRQVSLDALRSIEQRRSEDPCVFFREFGDSSINFLCFFWIDYKSERDHLRAKNDAVMAIKRAYDKSGITIPFPIRTLDFGIKGGRRLSQELLTGDAAPPLLSRTSPVPQSETDESQTGQQLRTDESQDKE